MRPGPPVSAEVKGDLVARSSNLFLRFRPSRKGHHSVHAGPVRLSGLVAQLQVLGQPQVQRVLGQHQRRTQPRAVSQLGAPPSRDPTDPPPLVMLRPPTTQQDQRLFLFALSARLVHGVRRLPPPTPAPLSEFPSCSVFFHIRCSPVRNARFIHCAQQIVD